MNKTVAKSAALAMKGWTCEYCGVEAVKAITGHNPQNGILACAEHEELGNRDVKAYLHELCLVRTKDFSAAFNVHSIVPDSFLMKRDGIWVMPLNVAGSSGPVIVSKPITDPRHLLSLNMGFYLPEYFAHLQALRSTERSTEEDQSTS